MLVARTFGGSRRLTSLGQVALLALVTTFAACSDNDASPVSPEIAPAFGKGGGGPKTAVAKILFARGDSNGTSALFTMNPDGTGLSQVSSGPYVFGPDWSPNRKKIVFWRYTGNVPGPDRSVVVMNANGTNPVEIASGYSPRWSPDGTKILFTRRDGYEHLWVMNADGSNPTQLTFGDWHQNYGQWSSDGGMIVFTGGYGGQAFEIFSMNADGSGIAQLTACGATKHNCSLADASPIPGDRRFVYSKNPNHIYNPETTSDIRTMRFDGSEDALVLTDSSSIWTHQVVWSPDGSRFAFTSPMAYGNHSDVLVMNVDGTGIQPIVNHAGKWVNGMSW